MTGPAGAGDAAEVEVTRAFRSASGRALATVTRLLGDLGWAEDAVQDAFEIALRTWPERGVPDEPGAWIATTARNRAIDRARREGRRGDREVAAVAGTPPGATADDAPDALEEVHPVSDDQLRLLTTCCHPALAPEAQVGLTLRLVCGLPTAAIARAFLEPVPTVAQRLSRAKAKIRTANIPFRAPSPEELPERLGAVLSCIELVFARGYAPGDRPTVVDADLCDEARRLARLLVELLPAEPEPRALHALLLFQDSRRATRADADGALVLLADQDRAAWDRSLITAANAELAQARAARRPGRYQLQAAIAAEHANAPSAAATDHHRIVALYDRLLEVVPSPVVALNRAVAVAERDGPEAGLVQLQPLLEDRRLRRTHRLPAVHAELLRRAGRHAEAAEAYAAAIAAAPDGAERDHLRRRAAGR